MAFGMLIVFYGILYISIDIGNVRYMRLWVGDNCHIHCFLWYTWYFRYFRRREFERTLGDNNCHVECFILISLGDGGSLGDDN